MILARRVELIIDLPQIHMWKHFTKWSKNESFAKAFSSSLFLQVIIYRYYHNTEDQEQSSLPLSLQAIDTYYEKLHKTTQLEIRAEE